MQLKLKGKRQKAVYRLVTAPQGGTQKYTLAFAYDSPHTDWSNRPRTAFRRWTQAVHQVAAIPVGRHRFLACPYRFLAAKRQAKADLSSGHSHDRTAFESFAPDISEQPDPNLTDPNPNLNSRDLMYRLGPAPKSGTRPI